MKYSALSTGCLQREDGAVIPVDPDNSDYAAFLASGETPEPYEAPPAGVPDQVSRRAARQVLLAAGLLNNVQPALDAIPDPMQRAMMQIEWEDSLYFQRKRPSLVALATALGLTSEQLDNLFIQAAALA
jgi:hypothetical protein